MGKKTQRREIDPSQAASYVGAGREFFRAADLAAHHEYWNAAGLLLVHASIAYADGICIHLGGVKSTSDQHLESVDLLGQVLAKRGKRAEVTTRLARIIEEKNRVSYTGLSFRRDDVESIRKSADRFRVWAEGVFIA